MSKIISKMKKMIYHRMWFSIKCFFTKDKNISQLKDKYLGKRCFIVATGPSLTLEDVEKLDDEITFGLNSIFMMYEKTSWRSTYYVCLDENHTIRMIDNYSEKLNDACRQIKFFNKNSKKRLQPLEIENDVYLSISSVNDLLKEDEKFYFRTELDKGVYNGGTVTVMAIIIAIYMGFKDIYLLGVDCNYHLKKKHFSKDWNDETMTEDTQWLIETRMKNGFKQLSKVIEKMDVNIYNATRGGMLEDFPRVDFDSLFEK